METLVIDGRVSLKGKILSLLHDGSGSEIHNGCQDSWGSSDDVKRRECLIHGISCFTGTDCPLKDEWLVHGTRLSFSKNTLVSLGSPISFRRSSRLQGFITRALIQKVSMLSLWYQVRAEVDREKLKWRRSDVPESFTPDEKVCLIVVWCTLNVSVTRNVTGPRQKKP